jgi:hypothetical protein
MPPTSQATFRRAQHLVSYWVGGDLLIHNYATGICVGVEPELPALLDYFHTWRTGDEIRKRFGASIRSLSCAPRQKSMVGCTASSGGIGG